MDETTRFIIDRITKKFDAPTKIREGKICSVYYDCTELTPNELSRLGALAIGDGIEDYQVVVPVSKYAILYAGAVAGSKPVSFFNDSNNIIGVDLLDKKVLLVSDVVHTGSEMLKVQNLVNENGGKVSAFLCIVDRSNGEFSYKGKKMYSALTTDLI